MNAEINKRTIIRVKHSDGTWGAQEAIVRRIIDDEVDASLIPGTERILPITESEAQEWVNNVISDEYPEVRDKLIKGLCFTDTM